MFGNVTKKILEDNLFLESGYLNVDMLFDIPQPFVFITGGRGIGKTFGVLKTCIENNSKFIYMRRTAIQTEILGNNELSVFNEINRKTGLNIGVFPLTKTIKSYYNKVVNEDGIIKPAGECKGYLTSLSTFSNLRSIDANSVDIIFLDEFCPESSERKIKDEAGCFDNMYETVNRNRELEGRKPVKCICAANANDLASPILVSRGLTKIMKMLKDNNEMVWMNKNTVVIRINDSPISKKKADTVLYKSVKNKSFKNMALNNDYVNSYDDMIKTVPLHEYKPMCSVGDITIYKHKSRLEYYISTIKAGECPVYGEDVIELKRWKNVYYFLYNHYLVKRIFFSEPLCEILFLKYINLEM